jgi:hypothetical protein
MSSSVFVALDSNGFVGCFLTEAEAKKLLDPFGVQYILTKYPLEEKVQTAKVWVLPYRGTEMPAYVTNDMQKAIARQKALLTIGQTIDDDVKYWEHPVGKMFEFALQRWAVLRKGMQVAEIKPAVSSTTIVDCVEWVVPDDKKTG